MNASIQVRLRHAVRTRNTKSAGNPEPFIGLEDIAGGAGRLVSEVLAEKAATDALVFETGDVLFGKLRPYLAKSVAPTERGTCTSELLVMTPTMNLDSRFLLYMTLSEPWLDWAITSSYGSKMPRTSWDAMADFSFALPPLDEQRRIADFLDTETTRLDALASLRERQRTLLAGELASILEAALVLPYLGTRVPLMHLTDPRRPVQYGIVLPGPDWPGGVPIIKGGDIAGRRLNLVDLKRTDPEIERRYSRSRVRGGDYVVAIRGSVGEIAPVPASLNGANLTQDSARIAPYGCDAAWLGAVLRTPDLQNQMRQQTTGATIKGINISELRRLRVPVPPRSEQQELSRLVAESFSRSEAADEALRASVTLLRERRQALITATVTGRFDVTTAAAARH